ncbi:hypothetical protein D917_10708 [Trichinella nativa]|uniref:Uncharacterized protein n=1 Tax=Trichinella nativa TaxID=6335 RepID=A0A1Y3ED39_9BILA|nr:hypothetical protein D917_10708 [Trichinella nativa]
MDRLQLYADDQSSSQTCLSSSALANQTAAGSLESEKSEPSLSANGTRTTEISEQQQAVEKRRYIQVKRAVLFCSKVIDRNLNLSPFEI